MPIRYVQLLQHINTKIKLLLLTLTSRVYFYVKVLAPQLKMTGRHFPYIVKTIQHDT